MSRFERLLHLVQIARRATRSEIGFAARAWLLAPWVEASLATLGVRRTLAWSTHLPRRRARSGRVQVVPGARWVDRAYAAHAVDGRCLPRAVVQHALHLADGVPCRLVIGVRKDGAALDAHAWVEAPESPRAGEDFAPIFQVDDRPGVVGVAS